jgi:hypothetical protein
VKSVSLVNLKIMMIPDTLTTSDLGSSSLEYGKLPEAQILTVIHVTLS